MARIPYLTADTAPPKAKASLEKVAPLNIFRAMANGDGMLEKFLVLGNHLLYKTSLDPVLREIAIVRVGHLSKARYELHQHEDICRQLGMREELIAAIADGPDNPEFTPLEADVVRFTDDVVRNVRASDDTYEALSGVLNDKEMVELVMTIGCYMMVCRFLETFGVEIEPEGSPTVQIKPQRK